MTALYIVWPVVAIVYALLGALGLALAIPPGYASPVFPAAGFALAVVLCFGVRTLPAIWLGSLLLNFGVALVNDNLSLKAMLVAVAIATGALLQAWAGQYLVRRWSSEKWQHLEQERDVVLFLVLGGGVACLISASCGVISLMVAGIVSPASFGYGWWNWYVGDSLGVLTTAPLAIGLLLRHRSNWSSRLKTIALPVLGVLALAVVTFIGAARWENANQKASLDDQGEILAKALEQRFIAHREALTSLSRVIEVSPDLGISQFDHFTTATLRDQQDLFALSFNPFVTQTQRTDFERAMAERVYPDIQFQITERDVERRLVRADERPEYLPVGYISPMTGNSAALGFDINSEPTRRDAIARARQSGRAAASAPIQLVQDLLVRVGVLVMTPAFGQAVNFGAGSAERQLIGFAVAVIKVQEMVDIAIQGQLASGLVLELEDPAADKAHRVLYQSSSKARPTAGELGWQTQIMMADRVWTLRLFTTENYLQQHRPWLAWGVGVAGLLFATLLQVILLAVTGRTALIQRKVEQQTVEIRVKNLALAKSEESYRSVVENIKEVIFQTDMQGRWTFLNPAWTEVSGFSLQESLGTLFLDYVHPEDRQRAGEFFELLIQRKTDDCRCEVRFCHHESGFRWVEVYARPTLDANHQLGGVSGTLLDVTERRAANDKLRQAMQKAEAANVAKSRFLATMSHEIRTPMNGVLGMAQLLRMPDLKDSERQKYAQVILDSGQNLLTLLNDILDLSKIEAGKIEFQAIAFRPAQLLHETAALFDELVRSKRLHLETAWQGSGASLYCADPNRLRQMLSNLVSNALKFTATGFIRIEAKEVAIEGEDSVLEFSVSDSGIGIPEDKLALLFKPFSQVDASNTREFGGTGLGLSIVRNLALLMKGDVGVESQAGKGSRFWFRIRVNRIKESPDSQPLEQGNAAGSAASPGLQQYVLVAEDSAINRLVVETMLTKLGLRVQSVENGQQVVERVTAGKLFPDLILMDCQMPVMDGYAATRQIRQWEQKNGKARLPIIALTAGVYDDDRERCLDAGMDDFLSKPVDLKELARTLGKWKVT